MHLATRMECHVGLANASEDGSRRSPLRAGGRWPAVLPASSWPAPRGHCCWGGAWASALSSPPPLFVRVLRRLKTFV